MLDQFLLNTTSIDSCYKRQQAAMDSEMVLHLSGTPKYIAIKHSVCPEDYNPNEGFVITKARYKFGNLQVYTYIDGDKDFHGQWQIVPKMHGRYDIT